MHFKKKNEKKPKESKCIKIEKQDAQHKLSVIYVSFAGLGLKTTIIKKRHAPVFALLIRFNLNCLRSMLFGCLCDDSDRYCGKGWEDGPFDEFTFSTFELGDSTWTVF